MMAEKNPFFRYFGEVQGPGQDQNGPEILRFFENYSLHRKNEDLGLKPLLEGSGPHIFPIFFWKKIIFAIFRAG